MSKCLFQLLTWLLIMPVFAADQSPHPGTTPAPPFVAPMPDNTIWTITVSRQGATSPPPGTRLVIQITQCKAGTTREHAATWSDGTRSDLWFYQGYRLEQKPGSKTITITKSVGDPENTDFTDFLWLSLPRYVGIESANNQTCYHFKAKITPDYVRASFDYSAYIAVKTKRPVSWDVGQTHFEMDSVDAITADKPVVLPPAFTEQLKTYRLMEKQANSYKNQ